MSWVIDITLPESIAERSHSVSWSSLTPAEQEIGSVYRFHWHLVHGDLRAVFQEMPPTEIEAAIRGLHRIGAPVAAQLLSQACANPNNSIELDRIIEALGQSEIAGQLVLKLPENYATTHPDEFKGPKSLLQQWESMQARGLRDKPPRLLEMERHAASDARFTDRRCATCGQPVPAYQQKCRRCGRSYSETKD